MATFYTPNRANRNRLPKFIPVDKRLSQPQQGAAYLRQAYAGQRALRELQGRIDETERRGLLRVMAEAIRLGRAKLKRLLQRFVRPADNHRPAYSPIFDSELSWKIRAGKNSGAPPRPRMAKPRWQAGVKPNLNSSHYTAANLIAARKLIPPIFFGRESCAPDVSGNLTLDDFADLQFACQISRLAMRGEQPLYEIFCELAARHLIRTSVENVLEEFLGDRRGGR